MLRRADVELGKGKKVPEVCKRLGIAQQTYYRWRQKYGGMAPEMAKELKAWGQKLERAICYCILSSCRIEGRKNLADRGSAR